MDMVFANAGAPETRHAFAQIAGRARDTPRFLNRVSVSRLKS